MRAEAWPRHAAHRRDCFSVCPPLQLQREHLSGETGRVTLSQQHGGAQQDQAGTVPAGCHPLAALVHLAWHLFIAPRFSEA